MACAKRGEMTREEEMEQRRKAVIRNLNIIPLGTYVWVGIDDGSPSGIDGHVVGFTPNGDWILDDRSGKGPMIIRDHAVVWVRYPKEFWGDKEEADGHNEESIISENARKEYHRAADGESRAVDRYSFEL